MCIQEKTTCQRLSVEVGSVYQQIKPFSNFKFLSEKMLYRQIYYLQTAVVVQNLKKKLKVSETTFKSVMRPSIHRKFSIPLIKRPPQQQMFRFLVYTIWKLVHLHLYFLLHF